MGGSGWPGVFFRDIWLNCIDAPDLKEYRIDRRILGKMGSDGGFWLERLHVLYWIDGPETSLSLRNGCIGLVV